MENQRILLIEDSDSCAMQLRHVLESAEYTVVHVPCLPSARALVAGGAVDFVVADLNVIGGDGADTVEFLDGLPIKSVIVTGVDHVPVSLMACVAASEQIVGFVRKSADLEDMAEIVRLIKTAGQSKKDRGWTEPLQRFGLSVAVSCPSLLLRAALLNGQFR